VRIRWILLCVTLDQMVAALGWPDQPNLLCVTLDQMVAALGWPDQPNLLCVTLDP